MRREMEGGGSGAWQNAKRKENKKTYGDDDDAKKNAASTYIQCMYVRKYYAKPPSRPKKGRPAKPHSTSTFSF